MRLPIAETSSRSWANCPGEIARPLNMLVWRHGSGTKRCYTAMCIQYPTVVGRGERQVDAVRIALNALLDHLYECHDLGVEPMSHPPLAHTKAFYTGKHLDLSKELGEPIPVRVSAREHVSSGRSRPSAAEKRRIDIRECEAAALARA